MRVIKASAALETPIDGPKVLQTIERIGRVCYKSEDRITEDSAVKFCRSIIGRGHESVIEHQSASFRIVCDRGVSHELVRHRLASYSQESSRYCVAGDALLSTKNPHYHITVAGLYNNKASSKNGSWKRIVVKQYNENTGELQFAKVKNIVCNGERSCIRIKTKLGYELTCTPDHEVLTPDGYRQALEVTTGSSVYVNGTGALYTNREWLYNQSITLNKTFVDIANEYGFNVSTVKKWARKLSIPKKGTGYFKVGNIPWNKGKAIQSQVDALRTYHHCGRRKDKILKEDTSRYAKRKTGECAICGKTTDLEVHHIDKNHENHHPENLITLCESCHLRVHSQNLLVAYADEVVGVEDAGTQTVYDVEMDSEFHNFVANGVIVHNCNYSKDKFGSEITVIKPCFLEEGTKGYAIWYNTCKVAEDAYFDLLDWGCSPEEARDVLPTSLKTEIVMTANFREWRHFIKLRTSRAAHPQMREVARLIFNELYAAVPVLFEDIKADIAQQAE